MPGPGPGPPGPDGGEGAPRPEPAGADRGRSGDLGADLDAGGLLPPGLDLPDLVELYVADEPIAGWRANNVVVDAARRRAWLVGVHHQRRYGAHAAAVCDVEDHAAPASGCHCGLHAWPTREGAEAYRRQWGQQAICRVELEGEIICHGEPGTEEIEGYRASHMTTLGVELDDRCWRCGRSAVALAPVPDGQTRLRTAFGPPEGLSELRPVCERCRRPDALAPADVAALLGTEVRLAGRTGSPVGLLGRLQEVFSRGPVTFLFSSAVLLAIALFGMLGAVIEGSWLTGALFALTTVAAVVGAVMLATGRGGRRLGIAIAAVTLTFLVAGPVVATITTAGSSFPNRATEVLAVLDGVLPAEAAALHQQLVEAGATSVEVAEFDPDHRALSFVVDGRCFQAGVAHQSAEGEGGEWRSVGVQSTGVALAGACPPAYPVLPEGSDTVVGPPGADRDAPSAGEEQAPIDEAPTEGAPAGPVDGLDG